MPIYVLFNKPPVYRDIEFINISRTSFFITKKNKHEKETKKTFAEKSYR
jgi:hypothetical protein